ncbi:hypothetical protein [Methanofollis fontis]|uniref:Uncharacterized protein n=1 Tax=Methanofollis fontis TaxID=2052832 RepID=A0A483CQW3_9EURY|nr:hypothetical protein [Methanofollis fontis]TAJ43630.1 hypothetical protein CUJ86_09800 [Methanofollis fontis]
MRSHSVSTLSSTWAEELVINLLAVSKRDLTMIARTGSALLVWWMEGERERHAMIRFPAGAGVGGG